MSTLTNNETRHELLQASLATMDYPARRDDLLRMAVADHLDVTTIDALGDLPDRSFHSRRDVLTHLRPICGAQD